MLITFAFPQTNGLAQECINHRFEINRPDRSRYLFYSRHRDVGLAIRLAAQTSQDQRPVRPELAVLSIDVGGAYDH